jgi:hypothetical protein
MGVDRVSAFMAVLPQRGISGRDLGRWRTAVEEFEISLGKAAGRPFGKYEINRFVQQRRVGGATDQDAAFLTAALADYEQWCQSQPPPEQQNVATAATAIRPEVPSAFKKIEFTEEERSAMRKKQLQVLGAALGVVAIVGGCVGNYVHRSSRIRKFSDAVRSEARRVSGPNDTEDLKLRVLAIAQEYSMRVGPEDVVTYIGEMSPQKMGMLAQSERMAIMEVMQQNTIRQMNATREERRHIKEPSPIYYVEVNVRGKASGLFGGSDFDFSNHVAVGEDLPHDSR